MENGIICGKKNDGKAITYLASEVFGGILSLACGTFRIITVLPLLSKLIC